MKERFIKCQNVTYSTIAVRFVETQTAKSLLFLWKPRNWF